MRGAAASAAIATAAVTEALRESSSSSSPPSPLPREAPNYQAPLEDVSAELCHTFAWPDNGPAKDQRSVALGRISAAAGGGGDAIKAMYSSTPEPSIRQEGWPLQQHQQETFASQPVYGRAHPSPNRFTSADAEDENMREMPFPASLLLGEDEPVLIPVSPFSVPAAAAAAAASAAGAAADHADAAPKKQGEEALPLQQWFEDVLMLFLSSAACFSAGNPLLKQLRWIGGPCRRPSCTGASTGSLEEPFEELYWGLSESDTKSLSDSRESPTLNGHQQQQQQQQQLQQQKGAPRRTFHDLLPLFGAKEALDPLDLCSVSREKCLPSCLTPTGFSNQTLRVFADRLALPDGGLFGGPNRGAPHNLSGPEQRATVTSAAAENGGNHRSAFSRRREASPGLGSAVAPDRQKRKRF